MKLQYRQSKNIQDRRKERGPDKDEREILRGLNRAGFERPGTRAINKFRDAFRKGQSGVDTQELDQAVREDFANMNRKAAEQAARVPKRDREAASKSLEGAAARYRMKAKYAVTQAPSVLSKKNKPEVGTLGKKPKTPKRKPKITVLKTKKK